MELLEGLNAAQREAVLSTEGFVRVIAGAGSGKTRALTRRFAYLVTELGILPGNLLCVTFTNKAANEMRQRIHNLTGDEDTGYINTFHGFCVSILQEDSHAVGYPKSFLVLDNSDIDAMLQIIYEERGLTLRDMTFSHARDMIEMLKQKERPEYYEDMLTLPLDTLKEKYWKAENAKDSIFYGYLYQEKKCFALDYNDLIVFTLHIFRTHEDIRLKWQKRLEYIMIDEFQDIDPPQYALMQVLCDYHKNLFIVGDPDQTIYTWRGADVRYLLDFDKVYPTAKTIMMMENYRSTPEILAACNSLIAKNVNRIKKDLLPMLPGGAPVLCHHAANSEQEARWIAAQIKTLHEAGTPYRDMAVLYRAHYITRGVEELLLKEKIPYTIYSGVQFFARAEIKDALSYLRMIACRDDLSFLRIANVPKRNLGERRMAFLKDYAAQNGCSLYDALRRNLDSELKGTPWQYSALKKYYAGDPTPLYAGLYLQKYLRYPMLEYLVKLKLYRLATYVAYGDVGGARYYDDSVLNSKGKTVTEVLGVGKKYIPLLQAIDPGPDQLTMIKAFLRDNIRPDLELMKWCSKNDIGEEAYITVPLRYMTPHKLMRYATEQFATHRRTSCYAPGYYSMRDLMSDYKDYLCMCELLEHDMKSSFVLFPNDLKAEHDRVNDMSRNDVSQAYDRRIAKMFEGWQHRYGYNKMGFVVIPPHSAKEITQEGDKLHHCVGRYVRDVVKSDTTILFIRKASAPKKPYCTVEVKHGDVVQARIQNNNAPPPKVKRFIESWKENVLYAPALERAG